MEVVGLSDNDGGAGSGTSGSAATNADRFMLILALAVAAVAVLMMALLRLGGYGDSTDASTQWLWWSGDMSTYGGVRLSQHVPQGAPGDKFGNYSIRG